MAIEDFAPKEEDKRKNMDVLYGYSEEEDKSWLQKFVDYLKQKKENDTMKLQKMGA